MEKYHTDFPWVLIWPKNGMRSKNFWQILMCSIWIHNFIKVMNASINSCRVILFIDLKIAALHSHPLQLHLTSSSSSSRFCYSCKFLLLLFPSSLSRSTHLACPSFKMALSFIFRLKSTKILLFCIFSSITRTISPFSESFLSSNPYYFHFSKSLFLYFPKHYFFF